MQVLVRNLHKDAAAFREKFACRHQSVAQVGQVRVDAVAPGVAEGFDLLGLAGDVAGVAVFYVAAPRAPLKVAVELVVVVVLLISIVSFTGQSK